MYVTLEDPHEGPRVFYPSTLVEGLCVEGWGFRGSEGLIYMYLYLFNVMYISMRNVQNMYTILYYTYYTCDK